jgi:hypothetical protein
VLSGPALEHDICRYLCPYGRAATRRDKPCPDVLPSADAGLRIESRLTRNTYPSHGSRWSRKRRRELPKAGWRHERNGLIEFGAGARVR